MYCSKCAAELPDDANFCFKCSNPVSASFQSQNAHARRVEPIYEEKTQVRRDAQPSPTAKPQTVVVHQNSGFVVSLSTILFLAILGGGIFFFYQRHLEEQRQIEEQRQKSGLNIHFGNDGASASLNFPQSTTTTAATPVYKQKTYQTEPTAEVANNSQGISCSIFGADQVNLHTNCDGQDCDSGSSTVVAVVNNGTQVTLTGRQVASSFNNVRNWIEINANGSNYFIAETKLACEQGE